jgi:1-acyl-sn-glycerol-3-phosphate acyltransferase
VQRVIHRAFRTFLRIAEAVGLVRTRWIGVDALCAPGARIVVANHPTLIDVVQLVSVLPQADCIVNDARTRNPFLALAARAAGYLSNAQGADLVDACAARLRQGRTVILFPEGTRSPATGLHPFHRGAAHVALATGAPIVPVAIRCEPRTLQKGRPFWEVPDGPPHFTLRVLEPVTASADEGLPPGVAARRTTAQLRSRLEAWTG